MIWLVLILIAAPPANASTISWLPGVGFRNVEDCEPDWDRSVWVGDHYWSAYPSWECFDPIYLSKIELLFGTWPEAELEPLPDLPTSIPILRPAPPEYTNRLIPAMTYQPPAVSFANFPGFGGGGASSGGGGDPFRTAEGPEATPPSTSGPGNGGGEMAALPVPLPPSLFLLIGAVGVLWAIRRSGAWQPSTPETSSQRAFGLFRAH